MPHIIQRGLNIEFPKQSKTVFLWGARKTGKSTLLKSTFKNAFRIDLLSQSEFFKYLREPGRLYSEYNRQVVRTDVNQPLIIDEIQKVPALLDEVHRLIEEDSQTIVLCGSSARKLKRNQSNLLGGRAWKFVLHPFTSAELGTQFNLKQALNKGLIPDHYFEEKYIRSIRAYAEDYLKEEIQMEGLVRNLPAFSRFLEVASYSQGCLVNYSNVAREVGVSAKTVKQYFDILRDTNIGIFIKPWNKRKKRQVISEMEKFYFFDVGVGNYLCRKTNIVEKTPAFGDSFEHLILMELIAYKSYFEKNTDIRFWRTNTGLEIDFIIGEGDLGIEIKATANAASKKLTGFRGDQNELDLKRKIVVSLDSKKSIIRKDIEIYPWESFLEELWSHQLF
jgi:uncharacterized protein